MDRATRSPLVKAPGASPQHSTPSSRAVLPRPDWASGTTGGLVKVQTSSQSVWARPRFCVSHRLPPELLLLLVVCGPH